MQNRRVRAVFSKGTITGIEVSRIGLNLLSFYFFVALPFFFAEVGGASLHPDRIPLPRSVA